MEVEYTFGHSVDVDGDEWIDLGPMPEVSQEDDDCNNPFSSSSVQALEAPAIVEPAEEPKPELEKTIEEKKLEPVYVPSKASRSKEVFVFGALVSGFDTQQSEPLAKIPSVKLHVTSKRPSLQIHGQTEFDVFANPIVSGDLVLYDGFATFKDGTSVSTYSGISGESSGDSKEFRSFLSSCSHCNIRDAYSFGTDDWNFNPIKLEAIESSRAHGDGSFVVDTLQEKFCDRALRLTDISDVKKKTITDTVIITHSMAGLVMSMAIATGKCSFGEGSTWVAISSPMTGSMASDYFQDFCSGETNNLATKLVNFFGQCPMPIARQSITYQNGKYSSKKLNAAYVKAQKAYAENVDAAMCSDNPSGVLSEYKPIFLLTAELVDHQSPENDGLVEFQSCAKGLDESKFGKSYKDIFYRPELNHADTAFLTSDGWFKDSQKPHKWFECLL
eukprot:jgi/Phyca11/19879/fgenesh1_pg.PHYCAscaffold_53_\